VYTRVFRKVSEISFSETIDVTVSERILGLPKNTQEVLAAAHSDHDAPVRRAFGAGTEQCRGAFHLYAVLVLRRMIGYDIFETSCYSAPKPVLLTDTSDTLGAYFAATWRIFAAFPNNTNVR
jgi:hypothetical protein